MKLIQPQLEFSAPSKTFLIGEYYITQEGEAFVITSEPCFKLSITKANFALDGIHSDSPAGKFILTNKKAFSQYKISFDDPHQGKGGFGASTAQFLLAYQALAKLTDVEFSDADLLKSYLKYAWNGKGIAPSGADILAQQHLGLCYINKANLAVKPMPWPFEDLSFEIMHTGHKLATHEHLASLDSIESLDTLKSAFDLSKQAFEACDSSLLCESINAYQKALVDLDLQCENTQKLIKQAMEKENILAAKGCGALGVDTLLLITKNRRSD